MDLLLALNLYHIYVLDRILDDSSCLSSHMTSTLFFFYLKVNGLGYPKHFYHIVLILLLLSLTREETHTLFTEYNVWKDSESGYLYSNSSHIWLWAQTNYGLHSLTRNIVLILSVFFLNLRFSFYVSQTLQNKIYQKTKFSSAIFICLKKLSFWRRGGLGK